MDHLPEYETLARALEDEFASTGKTLFNDAAIKIRLLHSITVHQAEKIDSITASTAKLVPPTGEELYMMVTGRFEQGSFPWRVVSKSGKAAWETAASELLLSPDTILSKLKNQ